MANISSGASLSASNFNNLFVRLDNIRKNHLNKNGQTADANSIFATAFNTEVAKAGQNPVPSNIQQIKTNLTTLANSAWLDNTFASKITIPTVGTLISPTTFNVCDDTITAIEGICPNYSQYSQYSNYNHYDQYGNYTKYGAYSNYDQYGNYSAYSRSAG